MNLSFALFRLRRFRRDPAAVEALCSSFSKKAALAVTCAFMALPQQATARDLTDEERDQISQLVGLELRDAETARFEWPEINLPESGTDFIEYCGWVNGRNAYGAYAGFVSFAVWMVVKDGEIDSVMITSGPGSGGVPSLDQLCVDQGFGRS